MILNNNVIKTLSKTDSGFLNRLAININILNQRYKHIVGIFVTNIFVMTFLAVFSLPLYSRVDNCVYITHDQVKKNL